MHSRSRSRFKSVFGSGMAGSGKIIIGLIESNGFDQTIHDVQSAQTAGVDGVFLVGGEKMNPHGFLSCYIGVKNRFHKDIWVGLEFSGQNPEAIDFVPADADAIWHSDIGIDQDGQLDTFVANKLHTCVGGFRSEKRAPELLHFGSVGVSGQNTPISLVNTAAEALDYFDVIVTDDSRLTERMPGKERVVKLLQLRRAIGSSAVLACRINDVDSLSADPDLIWPHVDCLIVPMGRVADEEIRRHVFGDSASRADDAEAVRSPGILPVTV